MKTSTKGYYYTAAAGNNRLRGIDTSSVLSLTYAYDMIGNVTAITETTNSGQVQNFAYDALNRLVEASTSGGGAGTYDIEYGYDAVGNIITHTEGATTSVYSYDDADHVHAVTDIGSWSFIYDSNGNMTSRVDGTGSYSQTFDVENRLIIVTDTQASEVTHFIFDGNGNRVVTLWPDSTKTEFVGPHYEVEGSTTRTYYFLAGQRVALRVEEGQDDDVFWFHTDHLGSTSRLTNEAGSSVITSTARYKPFGGYRTTPTADLTDHGYTGHSHNDYTK